MPLTFQPFALAPNFERLGGGRPINIANRERTVSGILGVGLVTAAFLGGGLARWPLLIAAGALILRAVTGRCAMHKYLEINRRHGSSGLGGGRGRRVEAAVDIALPADDLFEFWRNLEQLPLIMRHVESVRDLGGRRSHWKGKEPEGRPLEWDAEIITEHEGRLIAWQSLPGASVSNAGSVRFEANQDGTTQVKVALEVGAPSAGAGLAAAGLFGRDLALDLAEDLKGFKKITEQTYGASVAV